MHCQDHELKVLLNWNIKYSVYTYIAYTRTNIYYLPALKKTQNYRLYNALKDSLVKNLKLPIFCVFDIDKIT